MSGVPPTQLRSFRAPQGELGEILLAKSLRVSSPTIWDRATSEWGQVSHRACGERARPGPQAPPPATSWQGPSGTGGEEGVLVSR